MAENDVAIAGSIITIFVLLGVLLPYVQADFEAPQTLNDVQKLESDLGEETADISAVTPFTLLLSVLKMFFWTFGDLPFWLDAFFLILRVELAFIVARNVWVGGGG